MGYEAAYERYQQLQCYKGLKNNVAILLKRLRSRDIVKISEKANMPSPSINAARVTVVVLCVRPSVCPGLFSHYGLRGGL